eukprot:12467252-Alexandrium_andersonii.AAC.1
MLAKQLVGAARGGVEVEACGRKVHVAVKPDRGPEERSRQRILGELWKKVMGKVPEGARLQTAGHVGFLLLVDE